MFRKRKIIMAACFILAWAALSAGIYWVGSTMAAVLLGGVMVANGLNPKEVLDASGDVYGFGAIMGVIGLCGFLWILWGPEPMLMPMMPLPPDPQRLER